MKYSTPSAFRAAIEARLRNQPLDRQTRIRKEIVFDRILARLFESDPTKWVVKGGFALDLRFGYQARSTKDLDLLSIDDPSNALDEMLSLTASAQDDFFEFDVRIKKAGFRRTTTGHGSFHVNSLLDGRRFESINLDMEIAGALSFDPDFIVADQFLGFAGIGAIEVSLIALEQHLAEKIHAYVRVFSDDRENTRLKDMVDIVLIT